MLSWVLLVGVGVLARQGQASSHGGGGGAGGGGAGGSCNEAAWHQCSHPFQPSGTLAPYFSNNVTAVKEAWEVAATNFTILTTVCSGMEDAVTCLKPLEASCMNVTQNVTVPTVSRLQADWKEGCTAEMFCGSKAAECHTIHKDILDYLNGSQPNLTDSTKCQKTQEAENCVGDDMPRQCRASIHVQPFLKGMRKATGYCGELKCADLNQCKADFVAGGPKLSGLDDKTCFLYRNYTRCAGGAVESSACSDLAQREETPRLGRLADLLTISCTLMANEGLEALYTCPAFTNCIDTQIVEDILFLPDVCHTVQVVHGCALSFAGSCPGVNATLLPAYKTLLTQQALRTEMLGCGKARVLADDCTAEGTCNTAMKTNPNNETKCSLVQTYELCAGNAAESCNFTGVTPPAGAPALLSPDLKALSKITESMCTAMNGQSMLTCAEYMACTKKVPMPTQPAWMRINSDAWCQYNIGMVECGLHFTRTCPPSPALRNNLNMVYKSLIESGCRNIFHHDTQTPLPTTTQPTSGAQSQVYVSLSSLLLLAVFRVL